MKSRLFIIGVLFLISQANSQYSGCRNCDNGVIQTIDFIRQFLLSDSFAVVPGSVQTQQAYRLTENYILHAESRQIFSKIPYNFWFESTFRTYQSVYRPWYLIHVTDAQGITQISITLDATQQVIGIGLPDTSGNVQRVYFQHTNIFDQSWHKIFVSVLNDKVKLWIDCQPVLGLRGAYEEPLLPRKKFDTSSGYTNVAQYVDDNNQYELQTTTSQIDLQWMVLGCESTRPQPNCSELVYSESPPDLEIIPQTTARPAFIPQTTMQSIRQECPIQCPQGPPGIPGRDGQSIVGQKGERGERGFVGESIIGQKGEKGEPGVIVTNFEGDSHSIGELQIREICGNVVREQLAEMKPSLIGPIGPPGPPGIPGRGRPGVKGDRGDDGSPGAQGERGEKGERGEDGRHGSPGIQGLPGIEGVAGPPGRPGERGEDGRNGLPGTQGSPGQCPNDCYYTQMYMQQLQAAHAQQQTKGQTPQNLYTKG